MYRPLTGKYPCLIPLVLLLSAWGVILSLKWSISIYESYQADKDYTPHNMIIVSTHGEYITRVGDGFNCTLESSNGVYVATWYIRERDGACQSNKVDLLVLAIGVAFCLCLTGLSGSVFGLGVSDACYWIRKQYFTAPSVYAPVELAGVPPSAPEGVPNTNTTEDYTDV
jgi:hypothetical protein